MSHKLKTVNLILSSDDALYQEARARFGQNPSILLNDNGNTTEFTLKRNSHGQLELGHTSGASQTISFTSGKNHHRFQFGGGKNQPLVKACGLNKHDWTLLDATAGFAQDAFILARYASGKIDLVEQHPALVLLILDALQLAQQNQDIAEVTAKMQIQNANATQWINDHAGKYDVIYLDPMFPQRNKSAKVKKNMQLLHQLIGLPDDEQELLKAARNNANKRIVVKRPANAPFLDHQEPDYQVKSPNTRYDVYLPSASSVCS